MLSYEVKDSFTLKQACFMTKMQYILHTAGGANALLRMDEGQTIIADTVGVYLPFDQVTGRTDKITSESTQTFV